MVRLILALCLLPLFGAAQTRLLGANDEPVLTPPEGRFLDSLLHEQRQSFTFAQKRIAFTSGSGGTVIEPKSRAFQHQILPWTQEGRQPVLRLVPLTEEEKQASGGYDALVVCWAKVFDEKRRQRVLRALGRSPRAGQAP